MPVDSNASDIVHTCGKRVQVYAKRIREHLLARKNIDSTVDEDHTAYKLRRQALNLVQLTALGIGGTIGMSTKKANELAELKC
jgi:hypothetical protein